MTDPFTSLEIDVRELDGFLLNVERLMASELWALSTGDEFKAAIGLWSRAWKQVPAGSLPNDEKILAVFSGSGARWKKVRAMALRGFVLCSDGRLYHKTLCDEATRAATRKASFQRRREIDAKRLREWRGNTHETTNETCSETVGETRFVAEGREGKGSKKVAAKSAATARADADEKTLERSDWIAMEAALCEAAGLTSERQTAGHCDLSPILGLMDQGADFEGEILPAIRAKPNPKARSWTYFVPQIQEFRARRQAAANAPMPEIYQQSQGPPGSGVRRKTETPLDQAVRELIDEQRAAQGIPSDRDCGFIDDAGGKTIDLASEDYHDTG